jgi:dTDP-4-amino-4,6-dideoxygalactose transaminase
VGPIKHLSSPDGGFLLTPPERRRDARLARWHGLDRETSADFRCAQTITDAGFKYHQNDVIASILLANLPHAQWIVSRHRSNAAFYDRVLRGLHGVTLPPADPGCSYWLYYLLVDDREAFSTYMAERGIATSPVHARNDTQPAYSFPNGPLPGVDSIARRGVAIPCGWWIDEQERERVAATVVEWTVKAKVAA